MAGEGLVKAIETAVLALNELGLDYALIGGVAMPAWGRVRATQDADLLLSLSWSSDPGKRRVFEIVQALREAGFAHMEKADRRKIGEKLILHFWFPLRPQGVSLRLDIILMPDPIGNEIVKRAVSRKVNGFETRVASCEDLVLLKLAAGCPVDLTDAADLLALNKETLDWNYLEARAMSRNLRKELDQARGTLERN